MQINDEEKAATARKEQFGHWSAYQDFLAQLCGDDSMQQFEEAADAVVAGDAAGIMRVSPIMRRSWNCSSAVALR